MTQNVLHSNYNLFTGDNIILAWSWLGIMIDQDFSPFDPISYLLLLLYYL